MKVTAVKGKAAVYVINWGRAPFATERTKRGVAYIPDGFMVEAKSDSQIWIAETRVNDKGVAEYRFSLKENTDIKSEWRGNPTAAYKEVNVRSGNSKFATGSNGRLIIGVTYENLQNEIFKRFTEELKDYAPTALASSDESDSSATTSDVESATRTPRFLPGEQILSFPVSSIHPAVMPRRTESTEEKVVKKPRVDSSASVQELLQSLEKEFQAEQILLSLRHGLIPTKWPSTTAPSAAAAKKSPRARSNSVKFALNEVAS